MVTPSFCIVLIPGKDCIEVVEICTPTIEVSCEDSIIPRKRYEEISYTYTGNISYGVFIQEVWVSIHLNFFSQDYLAQVENNKRLSYCGGIFLCWFRLDMLSPIFLLI